MEVLTLGLFSNSKHAGEAVGDLKAKGYTDKISVIARDVDGEYIDEGKHVVKDNLGLEEESNTATGAVVGAIAGGLIGLFAGASAIAIPGGVFVVGPFAATLLGIGGGLTLGALTGLLVDLGLPEESVSIYTDRIEAGSVLVAVHSPEENSGQVEQIMKSHGVDEVQQFRK